MQNKGNVYLLYTFSLTWNFIVVSCLLDEAKVKLIAVGHHLDIVKKFGPAALGGRAVHIGFPGDMVRGIHGCCPTVHTDPITMLRW